jgi:leucyl/phenylalanyl-tRNA---protein transferase
MADPDENYEIYWYSPDPRAVFDLDKFHISHSLEKKIRSGKFDFKINANFEEVMKQCAKRENTWISADIIESYVNLFKLGYAFSFESYFNGNLAGGLYGVAIGGAFFGESMFHVITDASKAALYFLIKTLKEKGYELLDTQYVTPHLKKFGVIEIPKHDYMKKLELALKKECFIL